MTICVEGRKCLYGEIVEAEMRLNDAGRMVEKWWTELACKFASVRNDIFVVMPNHFHGIIILPEKISEGAHPGAPLHTIIQWYKTMTTNGYIHGVKTHGWPPFNKHLWQQSFYEHVVRDNESLNRIREYIATNPQRWELDRENPQAKGKDDFDLWLAKFNAGPPEPIRRGAPVGAPQPTRRQLGQAGEDLAVAALKKQGYKILERNYRTPRGEIDLIARQRGVLVFVEVKTRRSAAFGEPQEAVSPAKQARLTRLAGYYLNQKGLGQVKARFDVVAITLRENGPQIEIIPGAF